MTRLLPHARAALLGAAISVAGCATTSPTLSPAPANRPLGTLFIVGGGAQPPALVEQFVDLAGGPGKAHIVVFAMASEEGAASGEEKANDLRALGAVARNVWVDSVQANTDSVAHLLDDATGIWFGGGDQVRLIRALHGTRTEAAIHARYRAGAVVGGTSAGAAVMSTPMITGDELHKGGFRPDSTLDFGTIARDNIVTIDGFSLIRDAVVDQHFVRRRRANRLLSVVLDQPPHLGVGIDESTALIVHPDGHWSVAGSSVAWVFDARHATITPRSAPTLGATGVTVHVLPAGSTFEIGRAHV